MLLSHSFYLSLKAIKTYSIIILEKSALSQAFATEKNITDTHLEICHLHNHISGSKYWLFSYNQIIIDFDIIDFEVLIKYLYASLCNVALNKNVSSNNIYTHLIIKKENTFFWVVRNV